MPRQARLETDAGTYHVTSRGNRRQEIFADDLDRRRFLGWLQDVAVRRHWRCYAYCLMDNHVHLILETVEPNLGIGMHWLNGVYAQRFNARWDVDGHLFQDRFGSRLVDSQWHLLEAARYVVRNPVRAGLCADPAQWEWSSYRATIGRARRPPFLAADDLLGYFGDTTEGARAGFEEFVGALPDGE